MRDRTNLPVRHSIRLPDFDYSQRGSYFVTICAFNKQCIFGTVQNASMQVNSTGEIARACWLEIPNHFAAVTLEAFVIMPNHVHGILVIEERARHAVPLPVARNVESFRNPVPGSVPTIVRSYKSVVTKRVREALYSRNLQVWQSNYFERLLRNADEFSDASSYIIENPKTWHLDKENPG